MESSNLFILTLVLMFVISALLLIGSPIVLLIAARKAVDRFIHKLLLWFPFGIMSTSSLSNLIIFGLLFYFSISPLILLPLMEMEEKEISCLETPVTDEYKLIVSKLRNGEQEVYLDAYDGSERYINRIAQYAVVDSYIIGREKDSGIFFWFDLKTGGQRRFIGIERQDSFFESLRNLGITSQPALLSVDTICKIQDCKPCVFPTPTP